MEDRRMICDKCRKAVPMLDIKYLPKGEDKKTQLCSSCRQKIAEDMDKSTSKLKNSVKSAKRVTYTCLRCKYKFSFDPENTTAFKCPYCGKSDKSFENKPESAEKMIAEANLDNIY